MNPGRVHRPDRRLCGVVLLVVALVAVLAVPKVLNPPRVDGVAFAAPPPAPPVVGDCVDRSLSGYSTSADGDLQMDEPVVIVPCTEPHGSEIVRVAEVTPVLDAGDGAGPFDAFINSCWSDLPRWNVPTDGWWPRPDINLGIVSPDRRQQAAGQVWAACTIGVPYGTVDRTLDALSADGDLPSVFASCSRQFPQQVDSFVVVDCAQPHNHEDLGSRELTPGSSLTQDALVQSCTDLASRVTGRSALASDPALVVVTEAQAWYASGESGVVTLPLPADAAGGYALCSLHTVGDRELTSSLRRFGDGPLPFAT